MHRNKTRSQSSALSCQSSENLPTDRQLLPTDTHSALTPLIVYAAVLEPHVSPRTDIRSDWLTAARPETHQNLIHKYKDQQHPTQPAQKAHSVEGRTAATNQAHALGTRPDMTELNLLRRTNQTQPQRQTKVWWRLSGSNR